MPPLCRPYDARAIIADYQRNVPVEAICRDRQISVWRLYQLLDRHNIRLRVPALAGRRPMPDEPEVWQPALRPEQAPSVADYPESTNGRIGTARPSETPDALFLCAYYGLIGSRERARETCQ